MHRYGASFSFLFLAESQQLVTELDHRIQRLNGTVAGGENLAKLVDRLQVVQIPKSESHAQLLYLPVV